MAVNRLLTELVKHFTHQPVVTIITPKHNRDEEKTKPSPDIDRGSSRGS